MKSKTAQTLFHDYSRDLPIIDYHSHLPPDEIAQNTQFQNLSQVWLKGDHYKWRALRAQGVSEDFITGPRSDEEKFHKWAETIPYTVRNPLYHWTHLELQRYFGIEERLSPETAASIYDKANQLLQSPEFSVQNLLLRQKVEVVCTTDDPIDILEFHQSLRSQNFPTKVLPTFRPDKAMNTNSLKELNDYMDQLEIRVGFPVSRFENYLDALKNRHDYFAEWGCKLSDHGLETLYAEDFHAVSLEGIFQKIRKGSKISISEILEFKSALLYHFAIWDHEKGWVQQFHLGALRNNSIRAFRTFGPDTGFDSIGDFSQAQSLSKFLNRLDSENRLTKTIIYNLNPRDNAMIAAMCGNFNDGSTPGKVQFGSAWWFLDQKDGIEDQLGTLSQLGLISRMVGMLTDSRSFLSYPRHEYFRRVLCNLFGEDIENGELPNDIPWIAKIIQDISYYNARNYFGF